MSVALVEIYGTLPKIIWKKMIPTDQMSAFNPYSSFFMTSGAIVVMVPKVVCLISS
jgi:hypothetical protein